MTTTETLILQNKSDIQSIMPNSSQVHWTQRFSVYEPVSLHEPSLPSTSQNIHMTTTVPQNIRGTHIAGRHTPTRNSLRHSRMIVVNKNSNSVHDAYLRHNHVRKLNLIRKVLILHLALGLLITALDIRIILLTSKGFISINLCLSGLTILLASLTGFILLRRDNKERSGKNNCHRILLAESYVFSVLALVVCGFTTVYSANEIADLLSPAGGAHCSRTITILRYRTCTCHMEKESDTYKKILSSNNLDLNTPLEMKPDNPDDDDCEMVRGEWTYLLGFKIGLNALGVILEFLYIWLRVFALRNKKKIDTLV